MTLERLGELYRDHFDYVFSSARRLGVRREEVDDIVQETFLRVFRIAEGEEPRNMRAWLFSVLLRIVRHYHRARQRRNSEDADSLESLRAPAADPEGRVQLDESVRVLEAILDNLDPGKRAVLVLADIEEMTVAEIARTLGMNVNTAASRLRTARQELAEGIARHEAKDHWRLR
ncbi:MAG: sigma-70 family RNA polymerase sigma factor [Labilithrix sp.]|nr:sigma-70 family RNA polymerase sigma factor [Labilithrix sp.]MBX3215417.1 sigma-70 family RNA polymerase sigma factor [Labilithrix sp.]